MMWSKYTDEERKAIEDRHDTRGIIFSASKIEPLNFDLVALPAPNNSIDSDGVLSDGRCINIRLKYGWLTVRIGPAGVDDVHQMEILREVYVGFRGRLHPEQACEILGLTVGGNPVIPSDEVLKNADWDFSGRTTYLRAEYALFVDDADEFVQLLIGSYPNSCLLRDDNGLNRALRIVQDPAKHSTKYILGIGFDDKSKDKIPTNANFDLTEIFDYQIHFSLLRCDDREKLYKETSKECQEKGLADYEFINHVLFTIRMDIKTDSAAGQSIKNKLHALAENFFCKGAQHVDLVTPLKVLGTDENKSYSAGLRDWCLSKPNRYFDIQIMKNNASGITAFTAYRPIS